jgi:hypothetical protein
VTALSRGEYTKVPTQGTVQLWQYITLVEINKPIKIRRRIERRKEKTNCTRKKINVKV